MKRLQTAIGIAAGLVGLAAYLYLLGGLVMWLRFTAARLPTDDTVKALDSNRLLTVGMKAFLFELILVGMVLALAVIVWLRVRSDQDSTKKEEWIAWILLLQGLIAAVLAGALSVCVANVSGPVAILVGLAVGILWVLIAPLVLDAIDGKKARKSGKKKEREREKKRRKRLKRLVKTSLTVLAAALAVTILSAPSGIAVLVLLLFLHLSHMLDELPTTEKPTKLIPAVLILGAGLSLIVGAYLATPPVALDRALVVLDNGGTIEGGYVGQSGEGVFLATCVPKSKNPEASRASHLKIISPELIKRVVLGGPRYVLDYGKNPSLLDFGVYVYEREEVDEMLPTASVDVRENKLVCGLRHFLRLTKRTRSGGPAVVQQVKVHGAGRLVLQGKEVRKSIVKVKTAGELGIPIALSRAAARAHPCSNWVETTIKVRFRLRDGDSEERSATVALPSSGRSGGLEACPSGVDATVADRQS